MKVTPGMDTCFPPFHVGQLSHTSAAAFCPTAELSTDGCRTEMEATAGLLQMGSAESAQWGRQLVCRGGRAILAAHGTVLPAAD